MKEIKQIVEAYFKIDFGKTKAALATVVRVEGSSYRRAGARMLVLENGHWFGGISGGCLEGDALKKARLVMAQNKAIIVTYDTTTDDPFQIGVGLGCNGIIDVLITPIDPNNAENAVLILEKCLSQRQSNLLLTVVGLSKNIEKLTLGQVFKFEDYTNFESNFEWPEISKQVLASISNVIETKVSFSKEFIFKDNSNVKLFFEVIPPAIQLYLFGSNYDIYPMANQAKILGWQSIVVCNPLKMSPILMAIADKIVDKDYQIEVDSQSAAILMHHDYENDYQNLKKLLATDISFIGMLGPKKRTIKMYQRMNDEGFQLSETDKNRIHSPVGLDIGAASPEEIALSATAEIKSFFAKRNGGSLRLREKGIYEE
jgi:xanthine dehydrogenase accessory factor